ncbi:MAG: lamin tail domain-containing protein [Patescibacteria group bacterium]|nr:lamin tail domain-containing protein [Patescibacteria group bacterium]
MKWKKIWIFFLIFLVSPFFVKNQIFAETTIVINEFLVDPDADQWVELYNKSDGSIDISGWFIDDSGGTEKFTVPPNAIIGAKEFKVFGSGHFNLNRASADTINLINGSAIEDSYSYGTGPGTNKSYGREKDGENNWVIFDSPTKETSNNTSNAVLIVTPTSSPTPTSKPTPTQKPTSTPKPTATTKPTPTTKTESAIKKTQVTLASKQSETEVNENQSTNISLSKTYSKNNKNVDLDESSHSSILGDQVFGSSAAEIKPSISKISPTEVVKTLGSFKNNLSKIFIFFGVAFLIACSILIFRSYRALKKVKNNDKI